MTLIFLNKVTRTYNLGQTSITALNNIDLQIEQGEFVAIWGPSGSGKSTLCNLIGTLDSPTSGQVIINDLNISDMSDEDQSEHRSRSIGFIFQSFNLISVLTALENVCLPLTLRGENSAVNKQKAKTILAGVGLEDEADRRPDKLSGGQQQRVAIARALITEPALVVADEPTANLDYETATQIVSMMRDFNRSRGTTFVFSTHDEHLLQKVSRRIRLQDGRVIEDLSLTSTDAAPETQTC